MNFSIVTIFPLEKSRSSVAAFDDVINPLYNSLVRLGHQVIYKENSLCQNSCNIIFGAYIKPEHLKGIKQTDIIFNLEQFHDTSTYFTPDYIDLMRNFRVLEYSKRNAEYLLSQHNIKTEFFRIGYDPLQSTIDPGGYQDIDVLFYGSLNLRRFKVIHSLRQRGINVMVPEGIYGAVRDKIIRRSKLILNIQRYDQSSIEIVRLSYLFANRKAVVSDSGPDSYIYPGLENACYFSSYEGLPDAVEELLQDQKKRSETAEVGFESFSKWTMDDSVREHFGTIL